MLTTVQRLRITALVLIVIVAIGGFSLNFSTRRKLKDVRVMSSVMYVAQSLERYKSDTWRYPSGSKLDLRRETILSEKGFAPGEEKTYYQGEIMSPWTILYQSNEQEYKIQFRLYRAWQGAGLNGKNCEITSGVKLTCR